MGLTSPTSAATRTQATGVALIVVEEAGDNRILIVAGANGNLSQSDIVAAKALIRQAEIVGSAVGGSA